MAVTLACGFALAVLVAASPTAFGQNRIPAAPSPTERTAFTQAQALHASGNLTEAATAVERFLEMYPQSAFRPQALAVLGNVRVQQKAYQEAVSILAPVVDQEPDSEFIDHAKMDLAFAYLELGRKRPAAKLLDAIATSRAAPALRRQAFDRLVDLAAQDGDVARAVQLLVDERTLPEEVVDSAAVEDRVRTVVAQAQDPMALETVFRAYPDRFPGDVALLKAAELYGARGDEFLQDRLLQRFVTSFSQHERAGNVRAQLERLHTQWRSYRYVIGLPLPYRGDLQPYAESIRRGAQLALEQWRAGLPDRFVGLVAEDYGGDLARLGSVVDKLVREYRALAVLGPMLSREVSALAPRALQWRVPLVSPTATAEPSNPNRYVFRTALTGTAEGTAVAQYAAQRLGIKRFVVLAPQDQYSGEVVAAFTEEVARQGGRVVFASTYEPGAVDFGREIRAAKETDLKQEGTMTMPEPSSDAPPGATPEPIYVPGFDAAFLPGDGDTVGLLAAQLAFYDIHVPLLGTSGWNQAGVIKTGGKYVEDGIFVDAFFPHSPDPVVQQFVKQFRARYQDDPDVFAAQAYDATALVIQAIKAGGTTGERVRDELTKINGYHGVSGVTGFGPQGEAQRRLSWIQIKNGRFVPAL
jgi:ABC-type branched-subunit amino acid transport system substrate-binding protein/predicted negative regulator of RcsB-dependent stress response